ncbi:MAG: phosphopyruvate hydratase [Gammaproteobacteria bacterium]|nr:phosphopyruvate hydratase [Gammaproteobacteria bacterium]
MNTAISSVSAYRIWDSRGRPTVEVEAVLHCGARGRGLAPAGASRGKHEAVDLRDGGESYGGYGVSQAIAGVNDCIAPALAGLDAMDQRSVDAAIIALDPTPAKAALGGNATIAASMAVLHAAAAAAGQPLWQHLAGAGKVRLPMPQIQIFGGGAHAQRRVDIQDFLVIPTGAGCFDQALTMVADVYRAAGAIMERRESRYGVADEGGWWPVFNGNEQALETLTEAIGSAGYGGGEVRIALDIAASEFYADGHYHLAADGLVLDRDGWLDLLCRWLERYPILSIEDPVVEHDDQGMRQLTEAVGERIQIVGDDYLVTNAARIAAASRQRCGNAVLIKPNQVGTITQAEEALLEAQRAGWGAIVSARSGETEDVTIAHLAVGWNAGQLKVGSITRGERTAKWNECLRIERAGLTRDGFDPLPVLARQGAQGA